MREGRCDGMAPEQVQEKCGIAVLVKVPARDRLSGRHLIVELDEILGRHLIGFDERILLSQRAVDLLQADAVIH